jgi:hypothetical protein
MKNLSRQLFIIVLGNLFCFQIASAQGKQIDRGKINGPFTIEFVNEKIKINPDEFFKLSELKLVENEYDNKYIRLTQIKWALEAFNKGKIKAYDILIKNTNIAKPFYAKIAFFNATENTVTSAVARYYEISIDQKYFENATRGRIATVFEYSEKKAALATYSKFKITWIIYMSDEPL